MQATTPEEKWEFLMNQKKKLDEDQATKRRRAEWLRNFYGPVMRMPIHLEPSGYLDPVVDWTRDADWIDGRL